MYQQYIQVMLDDFTLSGHSCSQTCLLRNDRRSVIHLVQRESLVISTTMSSSVYPARLRYRGQVRAGLTFFRDYLASLRKLCGLFGR